MILAIIGCTLCAIVLFFEIRRQIRKRDEASMFESYRIAPEGATCVFELRSESGEELRVRLGVLEAKALSDSLMAVATKMQIARQGGRSIETKESS